MTWPFVINSSKRQLSFTGVQVEYNAFHSTNTSFFFVSFIVRQLSIDGENSSDLSFVFVPVIINKYDYILCEP